MTAPRILIIAGPNGAGKTAFAQTFLPHEANCLTVINADLIAAGISPFSPDLAAIRAGRLMLSLMHEYVEQGRSFAFETTLSGRAYLRLIPSWQDRGYRIKLIFPRLPSPEAAIARVRQRVLEGGHHVPEPVIRRRFSTGLANFRSLYHNIVDTWALYDCSGNAPITRGDGTKVMTASDGNDSDYLDQSCEPNLFADPLPALRRAARAARRRAIAISGFVVTYRDGKLVRDTCVTYPDNSDSSED